MKMFCEWVTLHFLIVMHPDEGKFFARPSFVPAVSVFVVSMDVVCGSGAHFCAVLHGSLSYFL